MTRGYLALVLHAHLPYVRHPEHEHFLEEQWFFEAMSETYIPLVHVFEGLLRDGIDFPLTLSLSPPLVAMMRDPLLLSRYARRLDRLVELGEREGERTRGDGAFHPLARMYRDRVAHVRDTFRRYEGDIVRAFRGLEEAGRLEIITCNATHMFLPLADRNWAVFHAQIELAAREHERHFGRRPRGMWLAECGYVRGVDELLRELGSATSSSTPTRSSLPTAGQSTACTRPYTARRASPRSAATWRAPSRSGYDQSSGQEDGMAAKTVPATEFKARCLALMDEVAATGNSVVITKRGKPVVRLVPAGRRPRSLFGALRGQMRIKGDLVAPIDVRWEASR